MRWQKRLTTTAGLINHGVQNCYCCLVDCRSTSVESSKQSILSSAHSSKSLTSFLFHHSHQVHRQSHAFFFPHPSTPTIIFLCARFNQRHTPRCQPLSLECQSFTSLALIRHGLVRGRRLYYFFLACLLYCQHVNSRFCNGHQRRIRSQVGSNSISLDDTLLTVTSGSFVRARRILSFVAPEVALGKCIRSCC